MNMYTLNVCIQEKPGTHEGFKVFYMVGHETLNFTFIKNRKI